MTNKKHDINCEISNLQNIVLCCLTHPWNRAGADWGPEHFISAAVIRWIARFDQISGRFVLKDSLDFEGCLCFYTRVETFGREKNLYPETQPTHSVALPVEEKVVQLKK